MKNTALTLLMVFAAFGCSEKKDAPEAPAQEMPAKVTEGTATPDEPKTDPIVGAEASATEVELPTSADFESEAIEQITDESLEKNLAAIEKDLGE